jgi:hypothetical protein
VCTAVLFLSTRNSCNKGIGKLPVVGKVCKTKAFTWLALVSALLCGSSCLTVTRGIMG